METAKMIFAAVSFVSWGYSTTALIACQSADLPYPDWFPAAAAAAVVTFLIAVGMCVHDILTSEVPRHRSRRARRRDARCMGIVRYVDGVWQAVREDDEEDE